MKDIQATFGGDPRFVIVGVSCDESAEAPATYTKANALSWTQVFGGPVPWEVESAYAREGFSERRRHILDSWNSGDVSDRSQRPDSGQRPSRPRVERGRGQSPE